MTPTGRRTVLAAALIALASPVAGVFAQETPAAAGSAEAADSARLVERAREAQDDFEDLRRRNLPRDSRWASGRCDRNAGRMCWRWHERMPGHPRGEAMEIREARDSLLAELERAAEVAGADPWLLGYRVLYLLEEADIDRAHALAWQCGGAPLWWCSALEGLALHVQGNFAEAERAFDRALEDMGEEAARDWLDLAPLLDGDTRGLLDEAAARSPAERDTLLRRLWRLADPLYLLPGNDRRSEHLARRTLSRILSEGNTPYEVAWGDDMAELLLRYGWERAWLRVPPRPGDMGAMTRIVGLQHPDQRTFLPVGEVLSDPTQVRPEPWTPFMWAGAASGYAPAYAPVFLPMRSRILVLTRGDRALVAATFALPADTTWQAREEVREVHLPPRVFRSLPLQAGLVLLEPDGDRIHSARRTGTERGVLVLDVPVGEFLASVEVLDPGVGRAGRLRNGLEVREVPPDVPVLSDLLVVEGATLPERTDEALDRLRIDDRVAVGEPIVLGWELWGLGREEGEVLSYRLTLRPTDPGLLDRIGALLGQDRQVPTLEWEEPGPDTPGPAFRSTSMSLPPLPAGEYVLRLELELQGRGPLVSEQRLRIVEGDGDGGAP